MKSKVKNIYIVVQAIVFTVLAVSSVWMSISSRYEALKRRVDYRKLYGVVFVASVLEGIETFVVLRWFNRKTRCKE